MEKSLPPSCRDPVITAMYKHSLTLRHTKWEGARADEVVAPGINGTSTADVAIR